jgi:Fe-Mn family superoxide dismutase
MITLPQIPYSFDALMPYIDAQTVEIHYTKHHQGYVNKLNELIAGTEFADMELVDIIKKAPQGPIFNNAAQIWNHSFYRESLRKSQENNAPTGSLKDAIEKTW